MIIAFEASPSAGERSWLSRPPTNCVFFCETHSNWVQEVSLCVCDCVARSNPGIYYVYRILLLQPHDKASVGLLIQKREQEKVYIQAWRKHIYIHTDLFYVRTSEKDRALKKREHGIEEWEAAGEKEAILHSYSSSFGLCHFFGFFFLSFAPRQLHRDFRSWLLQRRRSPEIELGLLAFLAPSFLLWTSEVVGWPEQQKRGKENCGHELVTNKHCSWNIGVLGGWVNSCKQLQCIIYILPPD